MNIKYIIQWEKFNTGGKEKVDWPKFSKNGNMMVLFKSFFLSRNTIKDNLPYPFFISIFAHVAIPYNEN